MKFLTLFLASFISIAAFADTQVITLKDGSQIKGELVGVSGDSYTVTTSTMGDIHVDKGQVNSIASEGAVLPQAAPPLQAAAPTGSDMSLKMQNMQAQLMSNPSYMADIQQMMQDPEIVQIMSDPSFVQAVTAKDVNGIQSNPRTQELLSNPKMQALIEKIRGSGQPPSDSSNQ